MISQEHLDFMEFFHESLPGLDLDTLDKVRNLTLNRITELEQNIKYERIKFRDEVAARSKELGLTVTDLFPPEPRAKAPPKYQDPNDPTKTWAGKGKPPKWVKAALDSGKSLDDLLIPTTDVDLEVGF